VLTMAATLGTGRLLWAPPPRRSHVSGEKQEPLGGETRLSLDAGRRRRRSPRHNRQQNNAVPARRFGYVLTPRQIGPELIGGMDFPKVAGE
jgi:hypothetical protein